VLVLAATALLAAVFLNRTIYGRYLLALGSNPQAAAYSGIKTQRMTVLAYVISSGLAGLGGMLFVLDINSAQPVDFGNFYELYAIAAAVLGGCSLRGGEGSILGVLIGATLMQVLRNTITLVTTHNNVEFAIIGAVILLGVVADELTRRFAARRRAAKALQKSPSQ
jgi:ribose transport system permease protein